MRVVPQNLVLHGRRGLKALGLAAVAVACGSCARFPSGGAGNFTAITFTFKVAGQINTNYIYDVAIAASPDLNPNISLAPLPVINSNNPNGRVAGSPNVLIEYPSILSGPNGAYPFDLNRFALQTEVPNPNDPTNPVNLAVMQASGRGKIFSYTTPQQSGGDPSTLSFTVYTNMLADTDTAARNLKTLLVNILTMTRVANSGSGPRVIDALGDSRTVSGLNQFLQIDLRTARTYTNAAGFEPTGDTFGGTDPDVDIVDYTITVAPR